MAEEGERIAPDALPRGVAAYFQAELTNRPRAEIWRLDTDLIDRYAYMPGDFLLIDPAVTPANGTCVLAFHNEKPIFRLLARPYLLVASWRNVSILPLPIDGEMVHVHGAITSIVRQ